MKLMMEDERESDAQALQRLQLYSWVCTTSPATQA